MYFAAAFQQLPAVCIDLERAESHAHIETPEFPLNVPGSTPDLKCF
jgi:hypothetical protein